MTTGSNNARRKANEAMQLLRARDFDRAVRAFTVAIALDPAYAAAYYNRGLAYEKLGRGEEAKADRATHASLIRKAGTTQSRAVPTIRQNVRRLTYENSDVAGSGRYLLCFLLAGFSGLGLQHTLFSFLLGGFIGLGVQYMFRDRGSLAVWINAIICVAVIIMLLL